MNVPPLRRLARVVCVVTVLGLCYVPVGGHAPQMAGPALVVVVSVDGLSWPTLMRYRSWYTSGLKRLLDEGYSYSATNYRHINTETSPGHASLSTGAPPRVTGIVANRWLMPGPDGAIRSVYSTQMFVPPAVPGDPPLFYREVDANDRLYVFALAKEYEQWQASHEMGRAITRLGEGPRGQTVIFDSDDAIVLFNQKYGRPAEALPARASLTGPGNLRVDTLGDRLVAANPESRVVSVSAKDRAAVLLAGRDPRHTVYWFDQETGRFITSPYYDAYSPTAGLARTILTRFNRERAGATLPTRFGTLWRELPTGPPVTGLGAAPLPQPEPLMIEFQVPVNGLGFPHDLTFSRRGYFTGFYSSPFSDELVTDLAIEFINDERFGLGKLRSPDVLFVSLSAQDVVSHAYGPESLENLDLLRRLDLNVGRLLDALAARGFTRENVIVAFSADHGFAPIPEVSRQRDPAYGGGRLVESERTVPSFYQRLNRLLSESLCLPAGSRPIFGGEGWSLIYNRPALPMRTVEGACGPAGTRVGPVEIDRALPLVIRQFFFEELDSVLLVSQLATWPHDNEAVPFVMNDFDAERSGDAFLIPRFGVLMHDDPTRGTGHGTHHAYDTHVPLVFWGSGWRPGSSAVETTPYDLAVTLAARLGISLPDATGTALHAAGGTREPGSRRRPSAVDSPARSAVDARLPAGR